MREAASAQKLVVDTILELAFVALDHGSECEVSAILALMSVFSDGVSFFHQLRRLVFIEAISNGL